MIGASLFQRTAAAGGLFVNGRKIRLATSDMIGSGGEAEVYRIGRGIALKHFKQPRHADYDRDPVAQAAAAERLHEHQQKIPALLKLTLPPRVAGPIDVAVDPHGSIAGYTMPLVGGAEVLLRYGDRPFREQGGVTAPRVVEILTDLHQTVAGLHQAGVVIGDFNDLNVLVRGSEAWVIDIDSAQFGTFSSSLFTARFLDPRLTDGKTLLPRRPHDRDSDWFAFAVLAFRLLLLVDPYGGIHKPSSPAHRIPQDERALRRVSIFDPHVRVPRQAMPIGILPDDLLHYFADVFQRDRRGPFPLQLLTALQWQSCGCGLEHARRHCPRCTAIAVAAATIRGGSIGLQGSLHTEEVFLANGVLVGAAVDGNRLLWLEHRDGLFVRDDGATVLEGSLDPRLRFHLQPRATWVTRGDETCIVRFDGTVRHERADSLATNARHGYWIHDGTLHRDSSLGPEPIGRILGGLTRFWVGPAFGLGFYRASAMTVGFVFDAEARGLRDDIVLPRFGGQIVTAAAIFTEERCWLLLSTREQGREHHLCTVIRRDGRVEATHEEDANEGSWLAGLPGATATGRSLLIPTDEGVVRVEIDGNTLRVAATFPETAPCVNASTRLFATDRGLYAVDAKRIVLLRMG